MTRYPMRILQNVGLHTLVVTDMDLADSGGKPPEGFVRCAVRNCWVNPEWMKAEARDVRADKRVF